MNDNQQIWRAYEAKINDIRLDKPLHFNDVISGMIIDKKALR